MNFVDIIQMFCTASCVRSPNGLLSDVLAMLVVASDDILAGSGGGCQLVKKRNKTATQTKEGRLGEVTVCIMVEW